MFVAVAVAAAISIAISIAVSISVAMAIAIGIPIAVRIQPTRDGRALPRKSSLWFDLGLSGALTRGLNGLALLQLLPRVTDQQQTAARARKTGE